MAADVTGSVTPPIMCKDVCWKTPPLSNNFPHRCAKSEI